MNNFLTFVLCLYHTFPGDLAEKILDIVRKDRIQPLLEAMKHRINREVPCQPFDDEYTKKIAEVVEDPYITIISMKQIGHIWMFSFSYGNYYRIYGGNCWDKMNPEFRGDPSMYGWFMGVFNETTNELKVSLAKELAKISTHEVDGKNFFVWQYAYYSREYEYYSPVELYDQNATLLAFGKAPCDYLSFTLKPSGNNIPLVFKKYKYGDENQIENQIHMNTDLENVDF